MTSNKWLLSNVLPSSLDSVTFGDSTNGTVLRLGSLNVTGLPKLKDVLLVDGLKANLINISKLCDRDLFVRFTKDKCIILDQNQQHIKEGNKSSDNCYLLASLKTCLSTVQNNTNIWHKWMGHVSHISLKDTIVEEAIREVPNLK